MKGKIRPNESAVGCSKRSEIRSPKNFFLTKEENMAPTKTLDSKEYFEKVCTFKIEDVQLQLDNFTYNIEQLESKIEHKKNIASARTLVKNMEKQLGPLRKKAAETKSELQQLESFYAKNLPLFEKKEGGN